MESRRFVLAIVLVIAVIVITNLLFPPVRPEPGTEEPAVEQVADSPVAGAPTAPTPAVTQAEEIDADTIVVASPIYNIAISTRGAAVVGAELLRFQSFTRDGAVQLADPQFAALLAYGLRVDGRTIDLASLPFRADASDTVRLAEGDEPRTIWFVHEDSRGFAVRLGYTFSPDDYLIGVQGQVTGLGGTPLLTLDLPMTLATNEADPAED